MKIGKDITNGYLYLYDPNHPMSDKSGKVYIHRLVMSEKLGRLLNSDEIVHHIDENKENNDPENLELTNKSKHAFEHIKDKILKNKICENCKLEFKPSKSNQKYCSHKCS